MNEYAPTQVNKVDNGLSSEICVNLSPLIMAFKEHDMARYSQLSKTLGTDLKAGVGEIIFDEMIKMVTSDLSPSERETIENAPVSKLFRKHFVELIKNTIDEFIKRNEIDIDPTLTLSIHCLADNQVSLSLEDNGPGFNPKKLSEIAHRAEAPLTHGSEKYGTATTATHPPLLGGAGKGLLLLITDVDCDETLKLSIDNNPSTNGAHIRVTGPLVPQYTTSNRSSPVSEDYTTTETEDDQLADDEEIIITLPAGRRFGNRG